MTRMGRPRLAQLSMEEYQAVLDTMDPGSRRKGTGWRAAAVVVSRMRGAEQGLDEKTRKRRRVSPWWVRDQVLRIREQSASVRKVDGDIENGSPCGKSGVVVCSVNRASNVGAESPTDMPGVDAGVQWTGDHATGSNQDDASGVRP